MESFAFDLGGIGYNCVYHDIVSTFKLEPNEEASGYEKSITLSIYLNNNLLMSVPCELTKHEILKSIPGDYHKTIHCKYSRKMSERIEQLIIDYNLDQLNI